MWNMRASQPLIVSLSVCVFVEFPNLTLPNEVTNQNYVCIDSMWMTLTMVVNFHIMIPEITLVTEFVWIYIQFHNRVGCVFVEWYNKWHMRVATMKVSTSAYHFFFCACDCSNWLAKQINAEYGCVFMEWFF